MSEHFEVGAEITKLCRLLGVDPAELRFLETMPSAALRALRLSATDFLFDRDADMLSRVAAGSKLVPIPLSAKIAQAAFGPLLCAAVSGLLDPDRAVRTAQRLPIPFLADVAVEMDPRRAAAVIAQMPADIVTAVGVELVKRGEHVTMGRFVTFLPPATLRQALDAIPDADLLRTAFVLEDKSGLDQLMDIAHGRLAGIIAAAYEQDLWAEALDLLDHLDADHRRELGDVTATQPDRVLGAMIAAAHRLGAWDSLLPMTAAMSHDSLARFARVPAVHEPEVLLELVRLALAGDLWADLLPLTAQLPDSARRTVAGYVAQLDVATLTELVRIAHAGARWDALLPLATAMPDADRRRIATLPLFGEQEVLIAVVQTAARHELWAELLPLVDVVPADVRGRLATCLGSLTRDQMLAALRAATRSGNLASLVDVALAQDADGRARLLELVDEAGDLDEFAGLLTGDTPELIWRALSDVTTEIPARVRSVIAARAGELGRGDPFG